MIWQKHNRPAYSCVELNAHAALQQECVCTHTDINVNTVVKNTCGCKWNTPSVCHTVCQLCLCRVKRLIQSLASVMVSSRQDHVTLSSRMWWCCRRWTSSELVDADAAFRDMSEVEGLEPDQGHTESSLLTRPTKLNSPICYKIGFSSKLFPSQNEVGSC